MELRAKHTTHTVECCPYCGHKELGDLGVDKEGYTKVVCLDDHDSCGEEFYVLTGQRMD